MLQRQVFIYGFDELHRVKDSMFLRGSDITIRNIIMIADAMADKGICRVYAIDNTPELKKDFVIALRSMDFAQHIEFEDEVERDGIRLR